jgi:putative CocE/NonD family hydrolase
VLLGTLHRLKVLLQDRAGPFVVCPGVGELYGRFYPWRGEAADGYDTIEWVASLPFCDGNVGMYGFSYQAAVQLLAAARRPPHLKAIAPAMTSASFYDGWAYYTMRYLASASTATWSSTTGAWPGYASCRLWR